MNDKIIICKATPLCLRLAGFEFENVTKEQAEETAKFYERCLYYEIHSERPPFCETENDFQLNRDNSIADYRERVHQIRKATQWFKEVSKYSQPFPYGCYLMLRWGNIQCWHWDKEIMIGIAKRRSGNVTIIG